MHSVPNGEARQNPKVVVVINRGTGPARRTWKRETRDLISSLLVNDREEVYDDTEPVIEPPGMPSKNSCEEGAR